jgi:hypothetical protein
MLSALAPLVIHFQVFVVRTLLKVWSLGKIAHSQIDQLDFLACIMHNEPTDDLFLPY